MVRLLAITVLAALVCLGEASAEGASSLEAEVKQEVQRRIRSYIEHLEAEVQREEIRKKSSDQAIKDHRKDAAQREKTRQEFLLNLPDEEAREKLRSQLRAQYEKEQERLEIQREQAKERYVRRQKLLQEAKERYDFLDPAQEYNLTD